MHGFYSFWDGPGLRAGVGAADFLHVRHPIPQSRFASVGGCKPRSRPCGLLANQGGAAVFRSAGSAGSAGSGGSPAAVRVVGESGRGGCPGLPKTRGACLFVRQPGRAVGCRYGCRPARKRRSGRMPGRLRPDAWSAGICVGQSPEPRRRFAGKGCLLWVRALCRACCPQKMKGAPKGSLPHQKLTLKNYPLFGRPP